MNKAKKILLVFNILVLACIFYHSFLYQYMGFKIALKLTCSGMFASLGLINLIFSIKTKQSGLMFYIAMSVGLILAFLGDYFILFDFVKGALSFALGHICFVIAYCFVKRIGKWDLIIGGALFVGCLIFLLCCPLLTFDQELFKAVCIVYSLIISVMVGKACGNFIKDKNVATLTIMVASVLFFASDLMLVLAWFIKTLDWADNACMAIYYPALAFLAFSMLLMSFTKKLIENEDNKNQPIL